MVALPGTLPLPVLPTPHGRAHFARLRDEVARMVDEVPLYAGRPAPPSDDDPTQVAEWLAAMPTVTKRELRRGFPKALVRRGQDLKAEMARGAIEIIATSGTTENRLQVLWEWSWWDPQEREAMRLNPRVAAAMASGYQEAVLTTPVCGGSTCHVGFKTREERTIDGMLFLNQVADPTHWGQAELERMLDEWNDFKPVGVEADPAYLAVLCRHAVRSGRSMHAPRFVTLTYELATRGHKRAIAAALPSTALYALYGATEAGVLFMEDEDGTLRHNANHSHIELIDVGGGRAQVLVTTLGRSWMPLLRYDLGDVVQLAPPREGEEGHRLKRVEGRLADCLRIGGRLVTPAELDDAIDAVEPQIEAWQLGQDPSGWTLRVVGGDGTRAAEAVAQLVQGPVHPRPETAILPETSGKYRLVRPQ